MDKDVIDSGKNLKIITNYGAGFNNVDVDYAREKDIDVTNTPKASTNATADLTIGLILSVARRIVVMNYQELKALTAGRLYFPWKRSFRQDNWNYWFRRNWWCCCQTCTCI